MDVLHGSSRWNVIPNSVSTFSRPFRKVVALVRRVRTWSRDVPCEIYVARVRNPTYSSPDGLNGHETVPRRTLSSYLISLEHECSGRCLPTFYDTPDEPVLVFFFFFFFLCRFGVAVLLPTNEGSLVLPAWAYTPCTKPNQ